MFSSGNMLSKVLLRFNDEELKRIYEKEKTDFYSKAVPVITTMMFLLAISLEAIYRMLDIGVDFELPTYISLVNWVFLVVYIVMSILHTRMFWMQSIVCPSLTLMLFLYLSFVDYDYTMGSIYYS
jgi:hypothetical protein|tara:strand:- start:2174 stop:2548 length:375 start_codon:yes stop_codon:yes gene_type:complete